MSKKTDKFIFVEELPYRGASYLKTGWQAFVVFTVMINRKELEENHQFYHTSRRKVFYEKCAVPELKNYRFATFTTDDEDEQDWTYDDDEVMEIPLNGIQWATGLLNISEWPVTKEAIKKAFNRLSIKTHPDKGGDHKAMSLLNRAKAFLINSIK